MHAEAPGPKILHSLDLSCVRFLDWATTKLIADVLCMGDARQHTLTDHGSLKLSEYSHRLKHDLP